VWLAAGSAFGTYAVFVVLGYLKDVEADRATGYDTLPVHFGRRAAIAVSAGFLALGVVCSGALVRASGADVLAGDTGSGPAAALVLWGLGLALLVAAHLRALPVSRDDEAHPAIAASVVGYVAMHLGEASLLRPGLAGPAWVVLAISVIVLALRPARSQV